MEFMQKEKVERAIEREQDKREIKEMISAGVKKEVENSVKPLKEKQAQLENDQESIKKQFSDVLKEIKEVKTQLQSTSSESILPTKQGQGWQVQHHVPVVGGEAQELVHVVGEARRTIGLFRIDQADLERNTSV